MNFAEIITVFVKENIVAALLVFVIAIFVWYFVDERKHYRDTFAVISEETKNIRTTIMLIEDKAKRTEEKLNILSNDSTDVSKSFLELKNMLEKIEILINERLKNN